MDRRDRDEVSIRPWAAGDLELLERLLGDPETMVHLGGPESLEAIRVRHERYLRSGDADGGLFAVVAGPGRTAVGWVGYWESRWSDDAVWECGWHVLPGFQHRGVATAATVLMLERVRWRRRRHRFLHAFPSVGNPASNALCERLGFEKRGEVEVEYPKGTMMRSNDWRIDLLADGEVAAARCPECGAPVAKGAVCRDTFHALLALESLVPGGPGRLPHFYAVATYQLQHPESMRLTVSALAGLRAAVSDALDGAVGIPDLRERAQRGATAAGRVTRREGDVVPVRTVTEWSVNVSEVLDGGVEGYAERVAEWAVGVLRDLEAAEA